MAAKSVLIVDDNAINVELAQILLEHGGFAVRSAGDGPSALAMIEEVKPDLVLMDIHLPGINGFEVTRRIKAKPDTRDTIVVAVSADFESDMNTMRAAGFAGWIVKPIDPSNFCGQVRAYLGSSENPGQGGRSRKIVLVVDDDPVQLEAARVALEVEFTTVAAADGAQGLDVARRACPDAIVSNILMPRMSGFQLCQAVRKDRTLAAVPIVLLTSGSIQEADRELARTMGAGAIVQAGSMNELLPAIRTALANGARLAGDIERKLLRRLSEEFLLDGEEQARRLIRECETSLDAQAMLRLLHRWAGAGSTLGFPEISRIAIETKGLLLGPDRESAAVRDRLSALLALFEQGLAVYREGNKIP